MPISQIDLYRVENTEQFLNQQPPLHRDRSRSRTSGTLSSAAGHCSKKNARSSARKLWAELAEGQIRDGVVRRSSEFGAFVDLGGVDGLLHLSEMSWQRVQKARGRRAAGPDGHESSCSRSTARRARSAWGFGNCKPVRGIPSTTSIRPRRSSKARSLALPEFGAFVELEPGIEGLIHISELATHRVRRVTDIVKVGQEVTVMVLNSDKAQRRMSSRSRPPKLPTPRRLEPEPEPDEPAAPVKPTRPRTTPSRWHRGRKTTIWLRSRSTAESHEKRQKKDQRVATSSLREEVPPALFDFFRVIRVFRGCFAFLPSSRFAIFSPNVKPSSSWIGERLLKKQILTGHSRQV